MIDGSANLTVDMETARGEATFGVSGPGRHPQEPAKLNAEPFGSSCMPVGY